MTVGSIARWLLLGSSLFACNRSEESEMPPAEAKSSGEPSGKPSSTVASAEPPLASASADASATQPERLSVIYPGARTLHRWQGGHAHSALFATSDSFEKVKAYYRRYAAQHSGYKVSDSQGTLELNGGAAMGVIQVSEALASPPDKRLQGDERTLISSSRP